MKRDPNQELANVLEINRLLRQNKKLLKEVIEAERQRDKSRSMVSGLLEENLKERAKAVEVRKECADRIRRLALNWSGEEPDAFAPGPLTAPAHATVGILRGVADSWDPPENHCPHGIATIYRCEECESPT